MKNEYQLTNDQMEWASKRKHGLIPSKLRELIKKQKGCCALSGVEMIFDKNLGNPNINIKGCHPLYAAIDHISPSNTEYGFQLVCYDLNDLKGHLPYKIFQEVQLTEAWKKMMKEWRFVAENSPMNIEALKNVLRD